MKQETAEKLKGLRARLAEVLLLAQNPAVLWSGGLDSTMLLFLARKILPAVSVVQFRSGWSAGQRRFSDSVIRALKLKVFVYAPADSFLIPGENGGAVLVDDYSVRSARLPVIRDLVHDDSVCVLDRGEVARTSYFAFPFDVALMGWRIGDDHFALGGFNLPEAIEIGGSIFFAPLHPLTRKEVEEISAHLELPQSDFYASGDERLDTGNFSACSRCLCTLDKVFCPKLQKEVTGAIWDKEKALTAFQGRFN